MPVYIISLVPAINLKKGSRFSFDGLHYKTITQIAAHVGQGGTTYYKVKCGFVYNNINFNTLVYIQTKERGKV